MKKILLFINIFLLASSVFAETEVSAKWETNLGTYFPWREGGAEMSAGEVCVKPEIDSYWGSSSLYINGLIAFDALAMRNTSDLYGNAIGTPCLGCRLNEAYYDYNGGWWAFRAGRQIVQWGAADNFTVTNVICPDDNSKLSGSDLNDSKLGIDALRFSVNTSSLIADAYWIPRFTPSELPLSKNNPLFKKMVPQTVDLSEAGLGVLKINELSDTNLNLPEFSLKNGECGLRLSSFYSFADFSLYGFYGWEDSPFVGYDVKTAPAVIKVEVAPGVFMPVPYNKPDSIDLSGIYRRFGMIGADSSIPVGPLTLRLEAAFYPWRHFAASAQSQMQQIFDYYKTSGKTEGAGVTRTERHNQIAGVIGLDWMASDLTVSVQYYADYVFGSVKNLERENLNQQVSFSFSYSSPDGNLEAGISGIVEFPAFDSVIIPSVSYSVTDDFSVKVSAMLFNRGVREGSYSRYKDLSSLNVCLSYSF